MVKEAFIGLYLFVFRIVFTILKRCPLKNKVTFVASFGSNSLYVYREMMRQQAPYERVFLYKKSCPYEWRPTNEAKIIGFETPNIFHMLRSIYHLATSKYIVVDNYFGFLSAVHFKEEVECIQLWHAAGAIKCFGLEDRTIKQRNYKAHKRFLKVYKQFDKVVVGSEKMADIFQKAFSLTSENILRTGVPRTDFFYDENRQAEVITKLKNENPLLDNKNVILYAPTFRDHQLNHFEMKLDLDFMQKELGETHVVLLKIHPAVKNHTNFEKKYPEFVYDYSTEADVNRLLLVADYLITDYSSIPFEYALLGKPMIFFPNDLQYYQAERGLWEDYESLVPGPVVYTTKDIVDRIKDNAFDLKQIQAFSKRWNLYSNGVSSKNIVDYLSQDLSPQRQRRY